MDDREIYENGMRVRRAVLGEAYVDRTVAKRNDFNGEFQDLITRYAWGEIWTRPGLARHTRSLLTLAMMVALNRGEEFKLHVRAASNNGVTREEIREVLLQAAIYCGVPAANSAFRAAEEVFAELDEPEKSRWLSAAVIQVSKSLLTDETFPLLANGNAAGVADDCGHAVRINGKLDAPEHQNSVRGENHRDNHARTGRLLGENAPVLQGRWDYHAFERFGNPFRSVATGSEGWNGRFRGTGNGGFAGSLNYTEMAAAIRDGYATASTDTGHRADGIDADWALGHPEKITDFGYRAIHEMTLKAKSVVQAFYGDAPKHSYFSSCSNGGRQALMEAQRFPEDYDGILAGAPANYWTHLLIANFYASGKQMLEDPASYIPKEKIPAIANAVLGACDGADGLKDGIVSEPTACHFDPATIVCKGADSNACLTAPQAASVKRIYEGAHAEDGRVIYPGYEPGGEDGGGGWSGWITGTKPGSAAGVLFSEGFQRNMVFNDANLDIQEDEFGDERWMRRIRRWLRR